MRIIVFFISLFLSTFVFLGLFDNMIINIILIIQFSILLYYTILFLNFYIRVLIDSKKQYKIHPNDKDKFKYYRDILKDFSIGELGYIYNGRKKVKLLILAELEYLKLNKNISLNNEEIQIIKNSDNLKKSEKYVLEHYKFINDKDFKKYYLSSLECSLKKKKS